jgi:hydroxylamine reductase (hybrid-cluster protein)
MLILEKPFNDENFFKVSTIEDIKTSTPNSTLVFNYCNSSLEVFNFCKLNNIPYGVIITSVKELIFVSNLKAKYIFTDIIKKAVEFQKIANEYLLDTKVVYLGNSFEEIEEIAKLGIDAFKLKESL